MTDPGETFVATGPLYVGGGEEGTMPVLAHRAGDRISAAVIDAHPEWAGMVRPEHPEAERPPRRRQPDRGKTTT